MIHFISGLPRSGSTLLAAVLAQNPAFTANIMSPVGRIFTDTHAAMSVDNEAEIFLDDDTRMRILRAVFSAYYADKGADVIFDSNRRWTANADLLMTLFPMSYIICCVRDPRAIVDSLERLLRAHPLAVSKIIGTQSNLNVYSRFEHYMGAEGVLGFAYYALRDAFWGPVKDRLLFVEYDDLSRYPKEILSDLHKVLNLPVFKYDFENIDQLPLTKEFDARIGTPGLHDLKGKVVYEPRKTILPPDICNRAPGPFWRVKKEVTPAP